MGIVNHNLNEYIIEMGVPGAQGVANNLDGALIPFDGVIRGIFARLDVGPSAGGTQVTDIKLSNAGASQTSIFSGATKLNWASGSRVPTYGALTTNPPVVKKGDTLSLQTTTAGATVGTNLVLEITVRRSRASVKGTDTDSISTDSDAI